jgi:hypothetical protein
MDQIYCLEDVSDINVFTDSRELNVSVNVEEISVRTDSTQIHVATSVSEIYVRELK